MAKTLNLHTYAVVAARKKVLSAIERGDDPPSNDLDAALDDISNQPVPRAIIDYVRSAYIRATKPRRPGPKRGRSTEARDLFVGVYYQWMLIELRGMQESKEVKSEAAEKTAAHFRISKRTVERIIAARHN